MKDKKIRNYIILVVLLFIGLIFIEMNRKEPVDWTPTYINTDKNPYGTYICFNLLKDVFPEEEIYSSRYPITNELYYFDEDGVDYASQEQDGLPYYQNTSYIFVTHNFGAGTYDQEFIVDKLDVKNLLAYTREGNNVFIAAEKISPILLDSLKLKFESTFAVNDTVYKLKDFPNKEYAFAGVNNRHVSIQKSDSCKLDIRTLAESKQDHRAIFVKIKYGKGFIYIHSMPSVFSNYELLKPDKYGFAFTCLSYLPKTDTVIWDEYLKQGRVGEFSPFRVVWNSPPLLVAYYIILVAGLLYVLVRSKRTQRIIPLISSPRNTSLDFLGTLSNLYYKKQAYESIMEKRHSYFLDIVRNRYYLSTETIDKEFMNTLSLKSGVEIDIIESIFDLRTQIQYAYDVSNSLLLKYNEKLEEFYRKIKL